jgi:hypothetical protein
MRQVNVKWTARLALAAALLTLAAACGPAGTVPAPTVEAATALPGAGVTLNAPTQAPAATEPAPTEPAAPTPSAGPTLPPTEPPAGQIGPVDFPPNVNPLTGETVADPAALDRVPVAIKVANSGEVRPQTGLGAADLVFEYYTEGGITRFTAVFLGEDAQQVGSVRSARLIDLEIPNMYQALLAYSGASVGINEKMRAAAFFDRILTPDFGRGAAFWRDESATAPHNMFTSTANLRANAEELGIDTGRQDLHGMAFTETAPAGGQPGQQVTLSYNASYVVWSYSGSGQYLRWNDGVAHTDRATGQQLSAANVVVVYANHVCDWSVVEDMYNPQAYWYSIEIQLWATGPAKVFRDGQAYDVTWIRNAAEDMVGFVDASGNLFPLKPGNTWFQLVAFDSPTTNEGANWDVDPKEPGCVKAAGT